VALAESLHVARRDGLLRDKTCPSRIPLLGADVAARVAELAQGDPPSEATHWTAPAVTKVAGLQKRMGIIQGWSVALRP